VDVDEIDFVNGLSGDVFSVVVVVFVIGLYVVVVLFVIFFFFGCFVY